MPGILYVSAHSPHGPSYGAMLRSLNIARILKACGNVGMVLMPYEPLDEQAREEISHEFDLVGEFFFDVRAPRGVSHRLRRELDPFYAYTQGHRLGPRQAECFDELARGYDLVWFHGIAIPNSLGRRRWANSVLDIDDIQSQVHAARFRNADGICKRLNAGRQALIWRRRERVLMERFGAVCVCSGNDRDYLGGGQAVHVVPNGFEAPAVEPSRCPADPPRIGFIGTLRYAPNVDGLRWFIRDVWPVIKARCKNARLRLVGMDTDGGIATQGPDIDGLGFLENVESEVSSWSASIVPINVGGGTRIKIAEAFSRKCPVVSTRLGAYGYELENGRDCLLADKPRELAEACLRLLNDPVFGDRMAERAWRRFLSEWSWDAVAPKVGQAVEFALRGTSASD